MAARSLNRVCLIGRLGKNAETAYTKSQTAVTKFSLATSHSWKDAQSGEWKESTDWHNIVAWRVEKLAPYLTKGKQIYVEGRLTTRKYGKDGQDHWVTEVVAEDVMLLGDAPEPRT
jgi:single-strand DNA-binding protein